MFQMCPSDPDDYYKYQCGEPMNEGEIARLNDRQGPPIHPDDKKLYKPQPIEKNQLEFEQGSLRRIRSPPEPTPEPTPSSIEAERRAAFEAFQSVPQDEGCAFLFPFDLVTAFAAADLMGVTDEQVADLCAGFGIGMGDAIPFSKFDEMCDRISRTLVTPAPAEEYDPPGSPTYIGGKIPAPVPKPPKGEPLKAKEWLEGKVELPEAVQAQFAFTHKQQMLTAPEPVKRKRR